MKNKILRKKSLSRSIKYQGSIIIEGKIAPHVTINAQEDIVIFAPVEDLQLISQTGNIIIKNNVSKSILLSKKGEIYCNHITYSRLQAEKNIYINGSCINSNVLSYSSIVSNQATDKITGGILQANEYIFINNVDSSSNSTILKLDNSSNRKKGKELFLLHKKQEKLEREIAYINNKLNLLLICNNFHFINNFYSQKLAYQLKEEEYTNQLTWTKEKIQEFTKNFKNAYIKKAIIIKNKISTNTRLLFGNHSVKIEKNKEHCIYYYINNKLHTENYNKSIPYLVKKGLE